MPAKAKPWQLVLLALGLLALLYVGYRLASGGDGPRTVSSILLVDVVSGELFEQPTGNLTLIIPARHPDTNESTLLPVLKDEAGVYRVERRYLDELKDSKVATPSVDANGVVTVSNQSPKRLR